jgi:hypothetical protein
MTEQNLAAILAQRLFQLAFVVDDLSAAEAAARRLGAGSFLSPEGQLAAGEESFLGRPSGPSVLKVGLAYLGDLQLELVKFESGESTYGDFVPRHGTGLHHLGLRADSHDEFLRLQDALTALGFPVAPAGQVEDGTLYTYFDADAVFGCYLMLVFPGTKLADFYSRVLNASIETRS